jgi:PAS domain-containing protein
VRVPGGSSVGAGFGTERLEPALTDVTRETGASVGLLYLLPPGEQVLRLVLVSGVPPDLVAPWARVPMNAAMPVVDAMRERRLVWLQSREEMVRHYPRLAVVLPYEFMTAAAPLDGDSRMWGGLVLLWPLWHPPQLSPRERRAVTACGHRVAAVLQRAAGGRPPPVPEEPRILAARPARADPAQAMAAFGFAERLPVGCCALDLEGRLTFVNRAAAALVDAGAALLVGRRPWEVLLWLNSPLFEDRYRAALITRRPTSFTAVRPPDTPLLFRLYPGQDGISVQITPAPRREDADTAPPAAPVPAAEPASATSLYLLTHMAAALAEAAGVREVAEVAADQIVPAFGCQGMVLMTVEEGREHIIGHRGYSPGFFDRVHGAPVGAGLPGGRAATNGEGMFFPTLADFRRAFPHAPRYGQRNAWAFLPLIASGRPIGSLVLSYDRPRAFPPAERAVLASLAGLIAQALGRARLYDANQALAHTLQADLLPRALPRIPGLDVAARYLPAGHGTGVGGDFYDLIRRGESSAYAVIGDVQGHNTTAAALMGQIRVAAHTHATTGTPPDSILDRINGHLADLDTGRFTSCLIADLDLSGHRARLANAGHPPPLLRHTDGHTDVLRLPHGILLGVQPEAHYPLTEIPLPPGAVLALYTDGLVEIPGTDIDHTIARLAHHLAQAPTHDLDDLADTLVHHARRAAPRHDDIALLLIRPRPDTG